MELNRIQKGTQYTYEDKGEGKARIGVITLIDVDRIIEFGQVKLAGKQAE